jgi:uncharacterized membrane protein
LLYLGWRTGGWRDLWQRGGVMAAVFIGFNLPFILLSPGDWVTGVLGPIHDPLFALGVGLVDLSVAKVLPLFPATVYLVLEVAAYIAAFAFFTRRCLTAPALALLLPLVPMAFAWRSLHTYFMFLPLLAIAALVTMEREAQTETPRDRTGDLGDDAAHRTWSTYRIVTP